jgi:hypothetical protein
MILHVELKNIIYSLMFSTFQFGRYPLNLASYEQIFANFLLGKTPYGPGRFVFGCFEHSLNKSKFQLIKGPVTQDDEPTEEMKAATRSRRGSADAVRLRLKKV